jgi:hypothetical protein
MQGQQMRGPVFLQQLYGHGPPVSMSGHSQAWNGLPLILGECILQDAPLGV